MPPTPSGHLPDAARTMQRTAALLLSALALLAACSDDGPATPDVPTDIATDAPGFADEVSQPDLDNPIDIAPTPDDAPETTEPPPNPGEVGAPCTTADDCNDGWCLATSQGGLCSRTCTDTCPRGWRCRQNVEILPEFALVCMPPAPTLCRPCDTNADCRAAWDITAHACIPTGNDGSFCGAVCESDADCPADAFCANVTDVDDTPTRQCRPKSGTCDCGPGDIADEASTSCFRSNIFGRCGGRRTCTDNGLSECDADAPANETCNGGIDDDCDGLTDEENAADCTEFWQDADRDGFGIGSPRCLCAATGDFRAIVPFDCNDNAETVNPRATESCNTIDDDCNGLTDEPGANGCTAWFVDDDGDGFGLFGSDRCLCESVSPWVATGEGDCNDESNAVNPDATEICNGFDDDCDGFVDPPGTNGCTPYFLDADGDGFGTGDPVCLCGPQGQYSATVAGDCDDDDALRAPNVREACTGKDDDCDGDTDEADAIGCAIYWEDADRDTFGRPGSETCLCAPGETFDAVRAGDCDDARSDVNTAAPEVCDSADNNCNDLVDDTECGLPTINWPTAMRDGRRTGQPFGFEGPNAADTALLWKRQILPNVPFQNSPVIDTDGRIIVAFGGRVLALDPASGQTVWDVALPAEGFPRASPTVRVGGTVIVPAGNGVVIIGRDGQVLRDVNFGGEPGDLVTGTPIIDQNGIVYVISNTHARALDPAGNVLWATPIDGDATKSSDPALGPDGRLYFSGAERVYSMSRVGAISWTWCPGSDGICNPAQRPLASVAINEVGRVLAPMGHVLYQLADGLDQAFVITTTAVLNATVPARIGASPAIFSTGYTCCNPAEFPLVTVAGANGARWYNTGLSAANFTLPIHKRDGAHGGAIFDRDGDLYIGSNATTPDGQASFHVRFSRTHPTTAVRGTAAWTATVDGSDIDGVPAIGSFTSNNLPVRYVVFGDSSGTIYSYGK